MSSRFIAEAAFFIPEKSGHSTALHAICETVFYLYPAGWPVTRDGAVQTGDDTSQIAWIPYGPGRKGEDPARRRNFVAERLFDPSKALFQVFEE